MTVRVTINKATLGHTLGPVLEPELVRAGQIVVAEAKRRVGYSDDPLRDDSEPHMRDTIHAEVRHGARGPYVAVVADHPAAKFHHDGTAPHVIYPRPGGVLRFWSKSTRSVVFARKVNHPGTKPNRFLAEALQALRARYR